MNHTLMKDKRQNAYCRLLVSSRKYTMLASYIDQAMEIAVYEIIEDEETYWGEIFGLQGVWARHHTLEGCRRELREAMSDWLALRLRLGLMIPVIGDINLNQLTQSV